MAERDIVLDIQGVSHRFGANLVLHDINLKIIRGAIVGLVGPSGCGKSTLLRAIVGTHSPCQGKIIVCSGDNQRTEVRHPGRDRGIVYQRYSLFPFLTALENVAFGLLLDETKPSYRFFLNPRWRKLRKQHLELAEKLLVRVGLGDATRLYPSEMSGGMQQRVAIAQALIMKPEVLLLDEPFGALDEAMREELQRMLLMLYLENRQAMEKGQKTPYTIIIVTHELTEAIYVGDRVVGLSQYWDWQAAGLTASPGATITYDKAAPVFDLDQERDYESFATQRKEIRNVVFDPQSRNAPGEYRTFWNK